MPLYDNNTFKSLVGTIFPTDNNVIFRTMSNSNYYEIFINLIGELNGLSWGRKLKPLRKSNSSILMVTGKDQLQKLQASACLNVIIHNQIIALLHKELKLKYMISIFSLSKFYCLKSLTLGLNFTKNVYIYY